MSGHELSDGRYLQMMWRGRSLGLAISVTVASWGAPSPAYACKPIVVVPEAAQLPAPWQEQMSVLEHAVQDADQPWGCSGATLMVTTTAQGGVLTVARSGAEVMTRPLSSPVELVPQAKALLASASLPPSPPAYVAHAGVASIQDGGEAAPASAAGVEPAPDAVPVEEEGPRAFVDAAGVLRYVSSLNMLTSGAALRGSLPFARWEASLQGSYTAMVADLDGREGEVSYSEMGVALGGSYALLDEPVRLTAGLSAGLVFLDLEIEQEHLNDFEAEGSAADLRLGGELRLAIPVGSLLRILVAAETEIAPMALRSGGRQLDPDLPPLAPYTVALASGLGVALP